MRYRVGCAVVTAWGHDLIALVQAARLLCWDGWVPHPSLTSLDRNSSRSVLLSCLSVLLGEKLGLSFEILVGRAQLLLLGEELRGLRLGLLE